MAKDIRTAHQRGEEEGLSQEEISFYDALAENESAVEVMGDEQLRVFGPFRASVAAYLARRRECCRLGSIIVMPKAARLERIDDGLAFAAPVAGQQYSRLAVAELQRRTAVVMSRTLGGAIRSLPSSAKAVGEFARLHSASSPSESPKGA